MPWVIFALLLMILMTLTSKSFGIGKTKEFFLKESQELDDMKCYAKEKLEKSNEILAIRAIRKKYGLSLSDSKKIMDFAKE